MGHIRPNGKNEIALSPSRPAIRLIQLAVAVAGTTWVETMRPWGPFKDCRLARMSDGHYCLLRDLGPVKGGRGMRHHEVVIDFSRRGIVEFFRRLVHGKKPPTA
jgi:hypothetical protein